MLYSFIEKILVALQVPKNWEPIIILLTSYLALFLLSFIFKQILSLFNRFVITKAIRKSKNTWDGIFLDLGIFNQSINFATIIFLLILYPYNCKDNCAFIRCD